jgi:Ca2+-binding EF-hand superfamily protein
LDITILEGKIEKGRRDLIQMSDFNYPDAYRMLTNLEHGKRGIDCDDFFESVLMNLQMKISQDEVLIIFYKADKDGDGFWSYKEMSQVFTPSDTESQVTMEMRRSVYAAVQDPKLIFCEATRS